MTATRRSPAKSPVVQKLSFVGSTLATRGSRLVASASRAAAQGTIITDAMKEQLRSPPQTQKTTFGGRRIRDRIHKFDTASYKHQHRPHRNGGVTKHHRGDSGGGEGHETLSPIPPPCDEKENAPNQNMISSPPPMNPNYKERVARKNETNGTSDCISDEFATDGCQPTGPSFHKRHEASSSCDLHCTKKRNTVNHPLIQSPLRKHMKGVLSAASSNATCTMLKDPFPLLPSDSTQPLAAVANWERKDGEGNGVTHLDSLGTLTGRLEGRKNKIRNGRGHVESGESDGIALKDTGEAALDLLTSAAFLFKHSRRNLG